ncbi:MAG: histidine phosphatase family protein [Planctomycetaceae bacterium]|jgi:probable phosphoglycerate mutase|nr:histidine phosphatase family protein [Planctomycetaceae bacterium]
MKTLIIVRHGNTFKPDEESVRVGFRTDIPLVEEERSRLAGRILKSRNLFPDRVFAAPLLRTTQTAQLIIDELGLDISIQLDQIFSEIDYGLDEGKTETSVITRLGQYHLGKNAPKESILQRGKEEMDKWNKNAIPPFGWNVDTSKIISDWRDFVTKINDGETVLVVSSNGIIRFAPNILPQHSLDKFLKENNLKVTTAGICILTKENSQWNITNWNLKPTEENIDRRSCCK